MTELYIYTENFSALARVKNLVKSFLGQTMAGPKGVETGLISGLASIGQSYRINQQTHKEVETACVLSGTATLKWAIGQKEKGLIKKIIAGPNIVITPNDSEGILKSPAIDKIIVPSQWVKDFYVSQAPELLNKIFIWPAGVEVPASIGGQKQYDFLIYNKVKNTTLRETVKSFLAEENFTFEEIDYGTMAQKGFFRLLEQSRYMIYISESESQGLAMFEAWARGVPTLVWDRGFMEHDKYRFEGSTASPYLSEQTGMAFKGADDFKKTLSEFVVKKFSPREWVKNNATQEFAAKNYLKIINA